MHSELIHKISVFLSRLPGIGMKNAKKAAFSLINWRESDVSVFAKLVSRIPEEIKSCELCGAKSQGECFFCCDLSRDKSTIIVVANENDVDNINESNAFNGIYHILGGILSPSNGNFGTDLRIKELNNRILDNGSVQEIILAFEATIDGEATSIFVKNEVNLFCKEKLIQFPKFSKIAFGIPVGSKVSSVDFGTISEAISNRVPF